MLTSPERVILFNKNREDMIQKHKIGKRILYFSVQLRQERFIKIVHIEEALNIKVHKEPPGKHKAYKTELFVLSATTSRSERIFNV